MRFSTRAEYGLKAMVNLASVFPAQKNLKTIAQEENISFKYLERLANNLRKNNLVISTKGKGGGYVLSKNPKFIRIGKIVETLDGPIAPMKCGTCRIENKCSSSIVWEKVERQVKKTLHSIKLNELI